MLQGNVKAAGHHRGTSVEKAATNTHHMPPCSLVRVCTKIRPPPLFLSTFGRLLSGNRKRWNED
eukprot:3341701-Amphidinium_carterae.1